MIDRGTDYRTVAIIGCQSSGKSTLLNLVFGTKFEEMDVEMGQQQTTKGIWTNHSSDRSIIVYDIEGVDSEERGDMKLTFEQTTSLYALAMADVVMINMWSQDIGRHDTSNYGIFKVIFEANLKLFDQQSKKKLVFVLRDYNPRIKLDRIQEKLEKGLSTIWQDIYKDERHANSKYDDFFSVDYFPMPNKVYCEDQFEQKAMELRMRFTYKIGAEDSFFIKDQPSAVPIDGLAFYAEQVFKTIREQKELNLPDQRKIVAEYRCNEIRTETFHAVTNAKQDFTQRSERELVQGFGAVCQTMIDQAYAQYDSNSKQYESESRNKFKQELLADLNKLLKDKFHSQVRLIRTKAQSDLTNALNREVASKSISQIRDKFEAMIDQLLKTHTDQTTASLRALSYKDCSFKSELEQQV